jgi:LAS superfamily LD-carboxypeptidase LdcB
MSHRTTGTSGIVKSVFGLAAVTVTVIVLTTCAAKLSARPPAPATEQSTVAASEEPDPTEVVRFATTRPVLIANDPTGVPDVDASSIGVGDGFIAADETLSPFDVDQPAVGNLNPNLLDAIQGAASDAATDGIEIRVNSGWRSARYQQYLLNQAVIEYGSEQEARKWVDTPEQSSHVAGNAVDIAPTAADDWLLRKGSRYGLCQIYANEIWHFELSIEPGGRCPRPKTDASGG